jgi:hypothetical protein
MRGEASTGYPVISAVRQPSWFLRFGKHRIKEVFGLGHAHLYWVLPVLCGLYLVFGSPHDPEFGFPVFAALLACGIPIMVAGYSLFSFLTVSALSHVFAYPVPALMGMTLDFRPAAIEDYLWATTPSAMWACVVGMIGLAVGGAFANRIWRSRSQAEIQISQLPSPPANLLLVCIVFPIAAFEIYHGYYYHGAVTGFDAYNVEASQKYGFVGYFSWLALAGPILQIRRYTLTRTRRDLAYAVMTILVPLAAFLPSGSRFRAFLIIPLATMAFLTWEKRTKLKYLVIGSCFFIFLILTPLVEAYRYSAQSMGLGTLKERIGLFLEYGRAAPEDVVPEQKAVLFTRRLADYVSTGQVMAVVPETFPYRYFEEMGQWWAYLIPTILRPPITLSYAEGALVANKYGVRPDSAGSSPIMVLGDLFSRFGWTGIFWGMAFIGFLFRRLDFWIHKSGVFGVILLILLIQEAIALDAASLLVHFTFFTRNLFVDAALAYGTTWVLRRKIRWQ